MLRFLIKAKGRNIISNYADIENSYIHVRKLQRRFPRIIKACCHPQVIAHIASVISIPSLYFNNRSWDYSNILDWGVVGVGLLIAILGILSIRKELYRENILHVDYSTLHDLLTVARFEAENSIITLGGDLSWLNRDIESIREIKKEHPQVQIKIYYDKKKLSNDTRRLINTIQEENIIQLVPYPYNIVPNIRCMITDFNYAEIENCKIYLYPKILRRNAFQHSKDGFDWQEYSHNNNTNLYDALSSFLDLLDSCKRNSILIGICGINNSGKTSIINKSAKILRKNFTVHIVPDAFANISSKKQIKEINKRIISQSALNFSKVYNEQIIIFDRTPFDNYVYFLMREILSEPNPSRKDKKNTLLVRYNYLIKEQMKKFDLIYKIQRESEPVNYSTTWVSPEERSFVLDLYKELEQEYIPDIRHLYCISDTFGKDIDEVAGKIAIDIQNYYYTS